MVQHLQGSAAAQNNSNSAADFCHYGETYKNQRGSSIVAMTADFRLTAAATGNS